MPDFESAIRESGAGYVTCVGVDFVGIWRGKRMPAVHAVAAERGHGVPFSDVFWANTIAEDLIEPPPGYAATFPVKPSGFPDHHLRRLEPGEPGPRDLCRTVSQEVSKALGRGDPEGLFIGVASLDERPQVCGSVGDQPKIDCLHGEGA